MKQFKNIIKILIIGSVLVSFYAVSSSEIKYTVSTFFEIQDTSKVKQLDTLQTVLNAFNKIALKNDTLVEKRLKTQDSLEILKNALIKIDQQSDLLRQELKCEEVDSCISILRRKLDLLKKRRDELSQLSISLKREMSLQDKESDNLGKKLEIHVNEVQQNAALVYGSRKVFYKGSWYFIFVVNTDSSRILMHHKDSLTKKPYNTIGNVYKALAKNNIKPLMITNAGMYTTSFEPQGLFIENSKELFPVDIGKPNSNNFYLKPNGVFFIDNDNKPFINTTEDFISKYRSKKIKVKFATQSGPMLLIGGKIHPAFQINSNNKKIRSGVGVVNNNKVVFIMSIDDVNFYDFARLFNVLFNCKDALFLDGAISRMYLYDLAPLEKGGNFGPIISVSKF